MLLICVESDKIPLLRKVKQLFKCLRVGVLIDIAYIAKYKLYKMASYFQYTDCDHVMKVLYQVIVLIMNSLHSAQVIHSSINSLHSFSTLLSNDHLHYILVPVQTQLSTQLFMQLFPQLFTQLCTEGNKQMTVVIAQGFFPALQRSARWYMHAHIAYQDGIGNNIIHRPEEALDIQS